MTTDINGAIRLDTIDQRTLFWLMADARGISAPEIAEGVNVSDGTIRNRINQLEENGVIQGYTASIDFHQAGLLTNLYICTVPVVDQEAIAHDIQAIPGVVNVRELRSGKRNLHITAVGENTNSLQHISHALSELGVEIEEEHLIQNESTAPYGPFGPDEEHLPNEPTDFINLAGDANVIELTITDNAPVVGRSIEQAVTEGILEKSILIISIERGDKILTPNGKTELLADDVVTILSRGIKTKDALAAFKNPSHEADPDSS